MFQAGKLRQAGCWGRFFIGRQEGLTYFLHWAGRTSIKVLPCPGVLVTSMVPPWGGAAMDWARHGAFLISKSVRYCYAPQLSQNI